jgi:hypothetical protein
MTDAERHLRTIFTGALDRDSGPRRAAYLDEACGADAALREAARNLGISRATAYRHWTFARAWLLQEISAPPPV